MGYNDEEYSLAGRLKRMGIGDSMTIGRGPTSKLTKMQQEISVAAAEAGKIVAIKATKKWIVIRAIKKVEPIHAT